MTEVKLTKAAWKAGLSVPIVEEWGDHSLVSPGMVCARALSVSPDVAAAREMWPEESDDWGREFIHELGYRSWARYLAAFDTAASRADMADRFVRKANELGLAVTVHYE
ncbi:MAG: hypothetical protein NXI31_15945 [bacterium]|nr:hypothetical protein [bacterium]